VILDRDVLTVGHDDEPAGPREIEAELARTLDVELASLTSAGGICLHEIAFQAAHGIEICAHLLDEIYLSAGEFSPRLGSFRVTRLTDDLSCGTRLFRVLGKRRPANGDGRQHKERRQLEPSHHFASPLLYPKAENTLDIGLDVGNEREKRSTGIVGRLSEISMCVIVRSCSIHNLQSELMTILAKAIDASTCGHDRPRQLAL
jgi:hypothetical protein